MMSVAAHFGNEVARPAYEGVAGVDGPQLQVTTIQRLYDQVPLMPIVVQGERVEGDHPAKRLDVEDRCCIAVVPLQHGANANLLAEPGCVVVIGRDQDGVARPEAVKPRPHGGWRELTRRS